MHANKVEVYQLFLERTKGIEFTDYEKQKVLFQIVKNIPNVQVLNDSEETQSYATHRQIGLLQTTYNKYNDTFHTVINLGGPSGYNEFGSKRFEELLPNF